MKKSHLLSAVCAFLVVMLTGTALPVSAALVYEWVSSTEDGATGTIVLNEGIGIGDIFDPLTDITVFEFNVDSTDYGSDTFYDASEGWEAGSLRLCEPNCINHGGSKGAVFPKTTKQRIQFSSGSSKVVIDDWNFSARDGLSDDSFGPTATGSGDWVSVSTVPAPGALILFLSGIGMLGAVTRRFRKSGN